jgi:hypothetical protein
MGSGWKTMNMARRRQSDFFMGAILAGGYYRQQAG